MATWLLPLFPLSVVLLPSTPLPLHIFEDRYKQMMSDIMPGRGEFGVVLAKEEGIISIGCSATVSQVLKEYPDGRLDLLAMGQRRFRIVSVEQEKPYLRGNVDFFEDTVEEDVPADLKQRAINSYEMLRTADPQSVPFEPLLTGPRLSFQLGQFITDLDVRQALLTMSSEIERLKYLVSILPQYTVARKRIALAKRVAPRNGHAARIKDL
ncbi:MAG TPA: LON peptidase substrate-binding domain-containing protein [Bryobacteraceae bacterium]|nr:LON peptidase substrate-binding domain-containing protein [Bryobacteraceae bacterium]